MNDFDRILKKRLMKLRGFFWQMYSGICLRYTPLNQWLLSQKTKKLKIDRLHIGCGNILISGWLNISYEKREEYGRLKKINGCLFLNYKLPEALPVDDGSIQYLAASHFIEHLDLNEGLNFFKEAFRVMKRGGTIHISCPDLELYATHYINRNKVFFDHPAISEACTFKNAATPGEIFIAKAYDSGGAHRWFYDGESLKHVLERAGFRDARKIKRLDSVIPDIEKIELPEREIETVYVEAKKL